jgi:hypothetical protein
MGADGFLLRHQRTWPDHIEDDIPLTEVPVWCLEISAFNGYHKEDVLSQGLILMLHDRDCFRRVGVYQFASCTNCPVVEGSRAHKNAHEKQASLVRGWFNAQEPRVVTIK